MAELTTASKLHSTDYVSVFIGQLQGNLHMSSCDGAGGREKSHFCLPNFSAKLRNLLCLNVTNASKCVAKLTTASMLHSTDYVSVFIGQLQGILYMSSCDGAGGREKSHFCLPNFSAKLRNLLCLNVTNAREFVAEITTASKLHSTEYAAVFIGQLQDTVHMSSCGGTVGREKSHFCLPNFSAKLRNLLCLNLTNAREFVAEMTTASKLHSTEYAAVFIGQLQDTFHMSSCGGTVGREKSHFCLPSFSAKITLLESH